MHTIHMSNEEHSNVTNTVREKLGEDKFNTRENRNRTANFLSLLINPYVTERERDKIKIICDETNNTPESVANNEIRATVIVDNKINSGYDYVDFKI